MIGFVVLFGRERRCREPAVVFSLAASCAYTAWCQLAISLQMCGIWPIHPIMAIWA